MSRNLYTIAAVAQSLVDELESLRDADPGAWWHGAGEDLLRLRMASHEPLVASYRVILDGWGGAMDELVRIADGRAPAWLAEFAREVEMEGLGVWKADSIISLSGDPMGDVSLNAYAVLALQDAIKDGVRFGVATGCSLVGIRRVLGPSIDDDAFGRP